MSEPDIVVERRVGNEVLAYIPALAALRIEVFREYPYLYEGSEENERDYLKTYAKASSAAIVVAKDSDRVVGASTVIGLWESELAFQSPFLERSVDVKSVAYFGESVLAKSFRGHGLGHRFFDEREAHARGLGCTSAAFCAVARSPNDPRAPSGYHPHDGFWTKRGYVKDEGLRCELAWREVGDAEATKKQLVFWSRQL